MQLNIRDTAEHPPEYWESPETRPELRKPSPKDMEDLCRLSASKMGQLRSFSSCSRDEIKARQFSQIQDLVRWAYDHVEFYRDKYRAEGFDPRDLGSWDDFYRLPFVTKEELRNAGRTVHADFSHFNGVFETRSSGSTGEVLRIFVDRDAVMLDTLQGVRQFELQSGGCYDKDHTLTHVYTVPWWFPSVGGDYAAPFISSLVRPEKIAEYLSGLKSQIISLYPTNLESLLPFWEKVGNPYLVVTHSEMSSRSQRERWGRALGCAVLDEYSSEELTRIALELPCGHYHVHEDSVHLEVLNPESRRPVPAGAVGLAVGTNLLNRTMPFIRYVQGDYVTLPATSPPCACNWDRISRIEGRLNDSFIASDGSMVPAGSLLDATYRCMFDIGVNVDSIEMAQVSPGQVLVSARRIQPNTSVARQQFKARMWTFLTHLLGRDVDLEFTLNDAPLPVGRKSKPIRREFDPELGYGSSSIRMIRS